MRLSAATVASASVAILVGISSPARAFRTASDLPEHEGTPYVRWATSELPYRVHAQVPAAVGLSDFERATSRALAAWEQPSCAELSFDGLGTTSSEARSGDERVTVQFLRSWLERGFSADAAATTDVLYQRGEDGRWRIVDADILLNEQGFAWTTEGRDGARDVQAVLTHEAGHVLGLLHPCEPGGADGAPACGSSPGVEATVMYPLYTGEGQRRLSDDDEAGVCFLYEQRGCTALGCPSGMNCVGGSCRMTCGGAACGAGERCAMDRCVPMDCVGSGCEGCLGPACQTELGETGDPCEAAATCRTGYCSQAGYCTSECRDDGTCSPGFTCATTTTYAECRPEAGVFGASCEAESDCQSGFCLGGDATEPACTRRCDGLRADCPHGFACGEVDDEVVCTPITSAGCAVTEPGVTGTLFLIIFLLLGLARRRTR